MFLIPTIHQTNKDIIRKMDQNRAKYKILSLVFYDNMYLLRIILNDFYQLVIFNFFYLQNRYN